MYMYLLYIYVYVLIVHICICTCCVHMYMYLYIYVHKMYIYLGYKKYVVSLALQGLVVGGLRSVWTEGRNNEGNTQNKMTPRLTLLALLAKTYGGIVVEEKQKISELQDLLEKVKFLEDLEELKDLFYIKRFKTIKSLYKKLGLEITGGKPNELVFSRLGIPAFTLQIRLSPFNSGLYDMVLKSNGKQMAGTSGKTIESLLRFLMLYSSVCRGIYKPYPEQVYDIWVKSVYSLFTETLITVKKMNSEGGVFLSPP